MLSWRNFVLVDLCFGGLQSWSEGRCEVNIMSRLNSSYWNKLMRVQNGVLENESISSSCQAWCLTTSEWVNNHCYFVSFEHSVSLQVLHSHSNRHRLKFFGKGNSKFGRKSPQKCAWVKHWASRWWKKFEDMLIRFDGMYKRDRHTDRQTHTHRDTVWHQWQHRPRLQSIARQKLCKFTDTSMKFCHAVIFIRPRAPQKFYSEQWTMSKISYVRLISTPYRQVMWW